MITTYFIRCVYHLLIEDWFEEPLHFHESWFDLEQSCSFKGICRTRPRFMGLIQNKLPTKSNLICRGTINSEPNLCFQGCRLDQ